MKLSIMTSYDMLKIIYAEFRLKVHCYAACHYAEYCNAEFPFAECVGA
jgi:hypothetical protein